MTIKRNLIVMAIFAVTGVRSAGAGDTGWYFSAAEIDAAYRYQEQFGSRLRHPLKPHGCYYGQSEFVASFQGNQFVAPCRFITETTRHLKQLLETGAARYLFPLDADHAHLAVPTDLWIEKYNKLQMFEVLPLLLREPKLVALYHTAEHLGANDSKRNPQIGPPTEWSAKRNVLGVFDGRPITILSPHPDGSAYVKPDHYETVGTVYFLAHRLGEIVFSARGKGQSVDISFDEDSSEVP